MRGMRRPLVLTAAVVAAVAALVGIGITHVPYEVPHEVQEQLRGAGEGDADAAAQPQGQMVEGEAPSPETPSDGRLQGVVTDGVGADRGPQPSDSSRSEGGDRGADDRAVTAREDIRLQDRFAAETRDSEWALATEARLLDEVAQADRLSLTTVQVECRETVCHLRMTFPLREDLNRADEWLRNLNEISGFERVVPIVVMRQSPEANLYFERRLSETQSAGVAPAEA